MQNVKVQNMTSGRSGKAVANQFIISTDEGKYFQSYNSVIAFVPRSTEEAHIVLDATYWDYSTTTRKYLYDFLRDIAHVGIYSKADVLDGIEVGTFQLGDLNA